MKKMLSLTLVIFIALNFVTTKSNLKANSLQTNPVPSVNSFGHKVFAKTVIEKLPAALERCDQIVEFESEFIPNLDDYTVRNSAHFTISAYHINRYEKKDISTLDQSIQFTHMKNPISEPLGAKYCLLIDGGDDKPLLLCSKSQEDFDLTKSILASFQDCRDGKYIGGLKPATATVEKPTSGLGDIKKKCGLVGQASSPDAMLNATSKPSGKEEQYWIPGGHYVPGVKKPEDH